jgi:two-component system sensor histidine kinase UhpB
MMCTSEVYPQENRRIGPAGCWESVMANSSLLSRSTRPLLLGYGIAFLSVAAATASMVLLEMRWQGSAPISLLLLVIIGTTWFRGMKPGLLAGALSLLSFWYVYLPLTGAQHHELLQIGRLVSLAGLAAYVVWITATERREADALRRAVDTIPAMVWITGPKGDVEFFNRRWLDYSGGPLPEALKQPENAIHPDDRGRALEKWRHALVAGEPYEDEMRLRRGDGRYRWFLVRSVPLRDASGAILRWYGTSTEIEDRKRAEEALRESQELLRLVLATLPVGVAVMDHEGDVVSSNAAADRIWGRPLIVSGSERRAESKGYWHGSGKRIGADEWASFRALHGGETSLNELVDIDAFDGKHKIMQNSAAPIHDAKGAIMGVVVVNEDVTERVRAEEGLRDSARQLQRLSRRLLAVQEEERRHLARELHDEFGQILAAVSLHLQVAKAGCAEPAQASLDESAALVKRAGAQVRSLALELRPTMLESAGINATLRWLSEQHQNRTGVPTRVEGKLGDEVTGDLAVACFRVVQEALTNVARHAQAREVRIQLADTGHAVEVAIHDDGVGFDVNKTQEESGDGAHLGLIGMRERVQILGGRLEVESQADRGTCIRVSLPLPEPVAEPLA